jgi:hypothetical protein
MDRLLKEFLGSDDELEVAPAPPPSGPRTATDSATTVTAKPVDSDKEARREARLRRKADPDRRRKPDEFVDRYTTGDPREGFSSEEAIEHLREMADEMSPEEIRAATQQTLEHVKGAIPAAGTSAGASADLLGGLVTGLMGAADSVGGVGIEDVLNDLTKSGQLDSPVAKAFLGGIAAFAIARPQPATTVPSQPATIEEASQPATIEEASQPATIEEASQQVTTALPQSALATALTHEQATYATYRQIDAAGASLAGMEAERRWQAAQQLVQQIQNRL